MENGVHAICGAKTRSGAPCKQRKMKNGRCRMHGGKSTGPKTEEGKEKAALNSRKHGAYIDRLLNDEEKEVYDYLYYGSIEKHKLDDTDPMHMATLHRACVTYIKIARLDKWEIEREWEANGYHTDSSSNPIVQDGELLHTETPEYNEDGTLKRLVTGKLREIRWSKNTPPWDTHFQNYMKLLGIDRASELKRDADKNNVQAAVDGFAWLWGQKSNDGE